MHNIPSGYEWEHSYASAGGNKFLQKHLVKEKVLRMKKDADDKRMKREEKIEELERKLKNKRNKRLKNSERSHYGGVSYNAYVGTSSTRMMARFDDSVFRLLVDEVGK
jgi:hypothetical protein